MEAAACVCICIRARAVEWFRLAQRPRRAANWQLLGGRSLQRWVVLCARPQPRCLAARSAAARRAGPAWRLAQCRAHPAASPPSAPGRSRTCACLHSAWSSAAATCGPAGRRVWPGGERHHAATSCGRSPLPHRPDGPPMTPIALHGPPTGSSSAGCSAQGLAFSSSCLGSIAGGPPGGGGPPPSMAASSSAPVAARCASLCLREKKGAWPQ